MHVEAVYPTPVRTEPERDVPAPRIDAPAPLHDRATLAWERSEDGYLAVSAGDDLDDPMYRFVYITEPEVGQPYVQPPAVFSDRFERETDVYWVDVDEPASVLYLLTEAELLELVNA